MFSCHNVIYVALHKKPILCVLYTGSFPQCVFKQSLEIIIDTVEYSEAYAVFNGGPALITTIG